MVMRLDSLELTDDVKHYACWSAPPAFYNRKKYCLVGAEWIEHCKNCPYNIEG